MLDVEDQMLDALAMLLRFLEKPVDGMNETVRLVCLKEVKDLGDNTQRRQIMPHPRDRDPLQLLQALEQDAFPLPIAVAVERYVELYRHASLPDVEHPIVDRFETASKMPLTRVRNIHWDDFTYEGSLTGRFFTWAHLLMGVDLHRASVAERIAPEQMRPVYEHDTASLQYKLFTRWNLADSLADYCRALSMPEAVFLVLRPEHPATDLLVHFQFMLTTWIESKSRRRALSLKDAVLNFCRETPADVLSELMPPLAQIVVVDYRHHALYHFGVNQHQALHMLRLGLPEVA